MNPVVVLAHSAGERFRKSQKTARWSVPARWLRISSQHCEQEGERNDQRNASKQQREKHVIC